MSAAIRGACAYYLDTVGNGPGWAHIPEEQRAAAPLPAEYANHEFKHIPAIVLIRYGRYATQQVLDRLDAGDVDGAIRLFTPVENLFGSLGIHAAKEPS